MEVECWSCLGVHTAPQWINSVRFWSSGPWVGRVVAGTWSWPTATLDISTATKCAHTHQKRCSKVVNHCSLVSTSHHTSSHGSVRQKPHIVFDPEDSNRRNPQNFSSNVHIHVAQRHKRIISINKDPPRVTTQSCTQFILQLNLWHLKFIKIIIIRNICGKLT